MNAKPTDDIDELFLFCDNLSFENSREIHFGSVSDGFFRIHFEYKLHALDQLHREASQKQTNTKNEMAFGWHGCSEF
jgi:hypothetical protein